MSAVTVKTEVLPGHRVEVSVPNLSVGDVVEVTVLPARPTDAPRRSALDVIDAFRERYPDCEPIDADAYLREERDSWDR